MKEIVKEQRKEEKREKDRKRKKKEIERDTYVSDNASSKVDFITDFK